MAAPEPPMLSGPVFGSPGRLRTRLVRWSGRAVTAVVLLYLVLLGASLARAPWAPRISLPGIGPITPPVLRASPPPLRTNALNTPTPAGVVAAGKAGGGSGASSGSGGGSTGSTGTGSSPGSSTTTSLAAAVPPGQARRTTTTTSGGSGGAVATTSTTRSSPSDTAPGHSTTTTVAGSTTSTTHGRSGTHP